MDGNVNPIHLIFCIDTMENYLHGMRSVFRKEMRKKVTSKVSKVMCGDTTWFLSSVKVVDMEIKWKLQLEIDTWKCVCVCVANAQIFLQTFFSGWKRATKCSAVVKWFCIKSETRIQLHSRVKLTNWNDFNIFIANEVSLACTEEGNWISGIKATATA